ncbi:glycosyltransferase involved in cell wall biosynthesis [Roseimicrobium gellanilyticum]|uniref:Glycosyltransferase involved in cell wall biosynthesis n=1 Tax=Roseimicrobium gellanilyticum TaxID=748857 RepID=A0A366HDH3_9BACT|nr:glycosyltransferase family 2 protein [Roseimicrobium gellanilyticum]RBP39775.1 glycosyltransferase involved in cell wall biosynthesis [Roseimicrobium gellanilyticum]
MPERVAIVIPCYNHARYVGEALESVLAQTRKPDRILVIDDGSKDNSVEVLRSFEKRGVEVGARENRGAHNTINELVAKAATDCDFIGILNSDDRYLPDRVAKCLLSAQEHPGKAVFSTKLRVIDGDGALMPEDAPRSRWFHGAWTLGAQEGVDISEWLGQANFIATTTNVFARASYLHANPMRDYRFIHDYFFLSTAALENQIQIVPEVLLEYRVHGSNTIATKPEPLIKEMIRLQLDFYKHHAARLQSNAQFRERFYRYVRSTWDSISSLHAGLVQVALAQLAAKTNDAELEEIAALLTGPEMEVFPNKELTTSLGASSASGGIAAGAGALAQRVTELKQTVTREKAERETLAALARLRQSLLSSKWIQLGLALGFAKSLRTSKGKTPQEKLNSLRKACRQSGWLGFGAKVGSKVCRELRQLDEK